MRKHQANFDLLMSFKSQTVPHSIHIIYIFKKKILFNNNKFTSHFLLDYTTTLSPKIFYEKWTEMSVFSKLFLKKRQN